MKRILTFQFNSVMNSYRIEQNHKGITRYNRPTCKTKWKIAKELFARSKEIPNFLKYWLLLDSFKLRCAQAGLASRPGWAGLNSKPAGWTGQKEPKTFQEGSIII